jgi:hypothetical protein
MGLAGTHDQLAHVRTAQAYEACYCRTHLVYLLQSNVELHGAKEGKENL